MSWDKPDTEFMYCEGFSDLDAVNFKFEKLTLLLKSQETDYHRSKVDYMF